MVKNNFLVEYFLRIISQVSEDYSKKDFVLNRLLNLLING